MDVLKRLLFALILPIIITLGLIELLVKILIMQIIWVFKGDTPKYNKDEDWLYYRIGDYFKKKLIEIKMIHDFSVSYRIGNTRMDLSTPTDDENTPYNLAEVFAKIMKDSDANTDMVISELIDEFGYNETNQEI